MNTEQTKVDTDVLIIGAGISGLYQLYKVLTDLPEASVRVLEAGSGLGGTWFWNRYPGARSDSEAYTYGYFFSQELLDEWTWDERFAAQPDIERYLNIVADKFDLRRHITFDTRVASATYDAESRTWVVITDSGEQIRARFVITAVGLLSIPKFPQIPGMDSFAGESYHTALWPDGVELEGKRVAVIGSGASGIQITGAVADRVASLTLFQRSANWATPLNNLPFTDDERAHISENIHQIHADLMGSFGGFVHTFQPTAARDHTPEERLAIYEQLWAKPGFAKLLGNFMEVLFDEEINREFREFVAGKISAIVTEPEKARKLTPDHQYGAKRPPFENGFYAAFNRENIDVVSLGEEPIVEIDATGIRTSAGHYDVDVIIYATGFDAITGALDRILITGEAGANLKELWDDGPQTFLGIHSQGFPNLFFLGGPHSTGGNVPRAGEGHVDYVTRLLRHAYDSGITRVETTGAAVDEWTEHALSGVRGSVVESGIDWAWGRDTPGKKLAYRHYGGGIVTHVARSNAVFENELVDLVLD
ncbi:flavin-containing monooxygenase [Microbacterium gorillae]|uniref:flavin-containing monooxygenase n=1 Tax=Microbacterium gorillae TaxID=1231063 RepID=UPI00069377C6|nr:NAD(P)/FAD-dependent oxidoreductase [Microbacterium gorillae]